MGGGNRKEIIPKKRSSEKINQFCNSVGVWCVEKLWWSLKCVWRCIMKYHFMNTYGRVEI